MFNFAPLLIGAAIGAGTSAITGGNPLRGGLVGGLTGGLFGSGGWLEELLKKAGGPGSLVNGIVTNAAAGGDVGKGLAINASMLGGSQGFGSSLIDPRMLSGGLPGIEGTITPGALSAQGLKVGADALNPFVVQAPISETAAAMGGGLQLPANAAQIMGQNPSLFASLKDYMPSPQAIGKLALDTTGQSFLRPPVVAPAGGITAGKAPDIAAIEQLIKRRPRTQAGLLTDYFG